MQFGVTSSLLFELLLVRDGAFSGGVVHEPSLIGRRSVALSDFYEYSADGDEFPALRGTEGSR
jgi:hypothetical protein